jgi:hypothetical protein
MMHKELGILHNDIRLKSKVIQSCDSELFDETNLIGEFVTSDGAISMSELGSKDLREGGCDKVMLVRVIHLQHVHT